MRTLSHSISPSRYRLNAHAPLPSRHNIKTVRATFLEIGAQSSIDPSSGALRLSLPLYNTPLEISVVYYRAGYTPDDYTTDTDYGIRFDLERSRAIKCPSIPLQLAGTKKMQEYLTRPGVLEAILSHFHDTTVTAHDLDALRGSWMEMWALDGDGYERTLRESQHLVVKPQREGGGNNIYRDSIPDFVASLPQGDREAWIAMRLIDVPDTASLLIKTGAEAASRVSTVNELGIFGWSLFLENETGVELSEAEAGWLLRTKASQSNEGGIAVGISVLDSPLLVL